jgi:hypothetical protein
MLILGATASGSGAQVVGLPDVVGQWTQPFEEGGAGTPRCVPAQGDTEGFTVCKPVAQASAVLPDGRVFYYNGIESQENAKGPSALSLSPSSRDSQARVLDLRSGTPQWIIPAQDRGGQTNPNIKPGHQSYDDPVGAVGVHGVGGIFGALITGVFATTAINAFPGLIDGNAGQVLTQALAVAATIAYAIVATFAIVKIVDFVLGLRVPTHEEEVGLDLAVHGEVAYQQ